MGFFRSGVTWAVLSADGNVPWVKERFVRLAMRGEKTAEQDFSSDVGMKSSGLDLLDVVDRRWSTSKAETG